LVNSETHNLEKSVADLQSKQMNFDGYEEHISIQIVTDREHHPFPL